MAEDPVSARLREVITGEPDASPIIVVDYDPSWPERFRRESAKVRSALGETVRAIEHIGSTSVPRLAAKPIADYFS